MRNKQSGQALIIILLIMAVGLTMGLSVISRSTSDIKISEQEEEAARAFSIAELGIEQALLAKGGVSGSADGISYNVNAVTQGGSDTFVFGGGTFAAGETATLWLVEHNADGSLNTSGYFKIGDRVNFCWGNSSTDIPALEAILIYRDSGGVFRSTRQVFDPDSSRALLNKFESATTNSYCKSLGMSYASFDSPSNGQKLSSPSLFTNAINGSVPFVLRLKLLYNSSAQPMAVFSKLNNGSLLSDAFFPPQGVCYESQATTANGVSRKVRQCQFYKSPPGIFDYALFSHGNLVK